MKLKERTTATLLTLLAVSMIFPIAMAKPSTVLVSFHENAIRYAPDGTPIGGWTYDPFLNIPFTLSGKAYHSNTWWYNCVLSNFKGSKVIVNNGVEVGWATYTSPVSFLPIKDILKGDVTIYPDPAGGLTMSGSYTQHSYAFGDRTAVISSYPYAVQVGQSNMWYLGKTVYTVYP